MNFNGGGMVDEYQKYMISIINQAIDEGCYIKCNTYLGTNQVIKVTPNGFLFLDEDNQIHYDFWTVDNLKYMFSQVEDFYGVKYGRAK